MVRAVRYLVCLWLVVFAVACDSTDSGKTPTEKTQASILSFEATPSTVQAGQSTILSWVVRDALEINLLDDTGVLLANAALEGSHQVQPDGDTLYRLVATGEDGIEVVREVTVAVAPVGGPTVTLAAEPESVPYGTSATLQWESSDADRVVLRAGDEVLLDSTEELSGQLVVNPTTATIYEITAIGPGGESKASAEVVVQPVIHSFGGPSTRAAVGASVGLTWQTAGAESLTLRTPEGFSQEISADKIATGSAVATVDESGVFQLVAKNGRAEVIATFEVPLLGKPLITELSVSPETITRGETTTVTIAWEIEDANRVALFVDGVEQALVGAGLEQGTFEVELDDSATIRLDATNTLGTSSKTVEVEAVEAPLFLAFDATPSRVGAGEATVLRWTVDHTETVSLYQGDDEIFVDSTELTGNVTRTIDEDTTFRLVATNALGTSRFEERVVSVGAPLIDSFTTDAGRYGPLDDVTFSWTVRGGRSVQVVDSTGAAVEGCVATNSESGSCTIKAPAGHGKHLFTLEVENGAGQAERELELIVTDGPWIENFAATPTVLNEGETVRFSWDVANDRAGNEPGLTLADDTGRTIDLAGADVSKGFVDVEMDEAGTRTWTLTAATADTASASAEVTVNVVALATLDAAPSQPTFQLLVDTDLTIGWTTTNAVSLEIFRLDGGEVTGNALFVAPVGAVATGSWKVIPSKTNRQWRVVATNELGARTSADVQVEVLDPPTAITSFTASATNVSPGTEVTLSWVTGGNATLSPIFGAPRTLSAADGFIPAAQPNWLALGDEHCDVYDEDDDGCAVFTFPEGFSFPFDGVKHTSAQVFLNGAMGFDTSAGLGETSRVQDLPSSQYDFIHLAPFWADLWNWGDSRVRYQLKGTGADRHLVISWDEFEDGDGWDEYSFQVVLWERGAVDFRYGRMRPGNWGSEVGDEFVIGIQSLDGTQSHLFHEKWGNLDPWDDLEDTSIRYLETSETATGQRKVVVNKTTTFTLCADGHPERACQTVTVTVD